MTMPEPHKGTPVFDEAHFPTLSAKIIAPWSAYGASSAFCKCICAIGHLIAFLKRPSIRAVLASCSVINRTWSSRCLRQEMIKLACGSRRIRGPHYNRPDGTEISEVVDELDRHDPLDHLETEFILAAQA